MYVLWILGGSWLGVVVALVSVVGLEWIKGGGCVELGWMLQDIGCSGGVVGELALERIVLAQVCVQWSFFF